MKKSVLWTLVVCLSLFALSAQAADKKKAKSAAAKTAATAKPTAEPTVAAAPAGEAGTLKNDNEKLNYLLGYRVANEMKSYGIDFNEPAFLQGRKDGSEGKKPPITSEEAQQVGMRAQASMEAKQQKEGAENLKAGEAFLEANKKKPGVKVTEDGLQYKVIKEGTGPTAKMGDEVTVKYRGTLIDGREFDNSNAAPDGTRTFTVGQVVPGWNEALKMMNKGAHWELYIPAKLAYGERAPGGIIGPNATLLFDLEIVDIKPGKPAPSGMPEGLTPPTEGKK